MEKDNSTIQALVAVEEKKAVEVQIYSREAEMVTKLLEEIKGEEGNPFVIETNEDFEWGTELLNHAKLEQKRIKQVSETVTKPLYQALEAFRAIYRPTRQGWEKVEAVLKKKLGEYSLKKAREEEEAMRKIAEASQKGDFEKAMQVSHSMPTKPVDNRMSVKRVWVARIVDIDKVPEQYIIKSLNSGLIAKHIQFANGGKPDPIPGLVFEDTASVTMRAK